MTILQVALATPVRRLFDYLAPESSSQDFHPGQRVRVPFRNKQVIGIIIRIQKTSQVSHAKLKRIVECIDAQPIMDTFSLDFAMWASQYYQSPIGDALFSTLPSLLRQGRPAEMTRQPYFQITELGKTLLINSGKNNPRQQAMMAFFQQQECPVNFEMIKAVGLSTQTLQRLVKKTWIETVVAPVVTPHFVAHDSLLLNAEQRHAVQAVVKAQGEFKCFLLDGVTGSGKTEVYLQSIAAILQAGKQALVLVPEIGLTPQAIARFQRRFAVPIVLMHSGLTDRERLNAWLRAKSGEAAIIIGTRSAIFTPLKNPGIIIIDEEHDLSFKQQEGFRYSARDLALVRARMQAIPILLGSATPSLESLYNVAQKRYELLTLPQRAGNAADPIFGIIDLRNQQVEQGLSSTLLAAMKQHLQQGGQTLLFLNRRGYAPTLVCHACGWMANCTRCDARLTLHYDPPYLHCHHCSASRPSDKFCPQCNNTQLIPTGVGTERLEHTLMEQFPEYSIARIDRDTTRRKNALQQILGKIHSKESQILIGTQMLAKGHHFPDVTLVGILNADSGLLSADFRASERIAQLLIQVAGRAGRAERAGEVLIQTYYPDHPLLQELVQHGYSGFAEKALKERIDAQLPPVTYMALLKAEATQRELPLLFLKEVRQLCTQSHTKGLSLLGPAPSAMERKAGHYRAQLVLQVSQRSILQSYLPALLENISKIALAKQVRWAVDVDPMEIF